MSQGTDQFDELLKAVDTKADISALMHCLMVAFDGPAGLARLIRQDFNQLDPGSAGRIKIEMAIIDLMKSHTVEDEEFGDQEVAAMERRMKQHADRETEGNGDKLL